MLILKSVLRTYFIELSINTLIDSLVANFTKPIHSNRMEKVAMVLTSQRVKTKTRKIRDGISLESLKIKDIRGYHGYEVKESGVVFSPYIDP